MIHFDEEKQERKLEDMRSKEEEDLAQVLSQKYGIDYVDLSRGAISINALRLVPEEESREGKLAVFGMIGRKIQVALFAPNNEHAKKTVAGLEKEGYLPTLFMASEEGLERAWKHYHDITTATKTEAGMLNISFDEIKNFLQKVHNLADVAELVKSVIGERKTSRISRIFEIILAGALALKASDVHLEPEDAYVRLRYRLDGILTDITEFDRNTYILLLSRIKLLSGLKLNIKSEAQDGRFTLRINETDIEIRTSLLPGAYGESIVLRVLNPQTIALPMETLGIESRLLELISLEISKPNGMVIITGPTGSGKTTSLYAFLKKIHTPEIKIITIEDPIEYHLPGIVQTQTKKEYTFAEGLRSALRQDPDVIMVGEIRDEETAEIAINAALTGHLVFSTLHTNDAAGTFPRLIDLGVNPKIISSAINMAMAQRLLRKICAACKQEKTPTREEQQLINQILETIENKEMVPIEHARLWQAVGCDACNKIGYDGRLGIYEAILVDEAIDVCLRTNPSENEIARAAKPQGIFTMRQDGIIKVLRGDTTIEELGRVIDLRKKEA